MDYGIIIKKSKDNSTLIIMEKTFDEIEAKRLEAAKALKSVNRTAICTYLITLICIPLALAIPWFWGSILQSEGDAILLIFFIGLVIVGVLLFRSFKCYWYSMIAKATYKAKIITIQTI
jgi:K+-sensing histidine kinase KdpD